MKQIKKLAELAIYLLHLLSLNFKWLFKKLRRKK
jgi:hypothetical protein